MILVHDCAREGKAQSELATRFLSHLRRDEQRWILRGRVQNVRLALGHERGRCLTQVGCPIAAFVAPGSASFLGPFIFRPAGEV